MAHKEKCGQQLLCAAILSYIWGDPVRGPFYGLRHLQASDKFYFHAGGKIEFPLSELSSGIDFSRIIHIGNNMPVNLKVRRTWWSGWHYDGSLVSGTGQVIEFTNNSIHGLPTGWEYNHDEYAVEIVHPDGTPVFQLIQSSDYDLYVNAVLMHSDGLYTIWDGNKGLKLKIDESTYQKNKLTPLFKYPAYRNMSVRS